MSYNENNHLAEMSEVIRKTRLNLEHKHCTDDTFSNKELEKIINARSSYHCPCFKHGIGGERGIYKRTNVPSTSGAVMQVTEFVQRPIILRISR